MSGEGKDTREGFLSRWSRLKTEQPPAAPVAVAPAPLSTKGDVDSEPPLLPQIEELSLESDFRGFFHPKVDENVRRAALRKLFSDPHFNVMDGLDVYIEDYSKTEPIPAAMMAGLKQAERILRWAEGKEEEGETAENGTRIEDRTPSDADTPALSDTPQKST